MKNNGVVSCFFALYYQRVAPVVFLGNGQVGKAESAFRHLFSSTTPGQTLWLQGNTHVGGRYAFPTYELSSRVISATRSTFEDNYLTFWFKPTLYKWQLANKNRHHHKSPHLCYKLRRKPTSFYHNQWLRRSEIKISFQTTEVVC